MTIKKMLKDSKEILVYRIMYINRVPKIHLYTKYRKKGKQWIYKNPRNVMGDEIKIEDRIAEEWLKENKKNNYFIICNLEY